METSLVVLKIVSRMLAIIVLVLLLFVLQNVAIQFLLELNNVIMAVNQDVKNVK
jgi:hypothetical protein